MTATTATLELWCAGQPFAVTEARFRVGFGKPGTVELKLSPEDANSFWPRPGEVVEWQLPKGDRCGPLRIASNANDWYRCEADWAHAAVEPRDSLTVYQRDAGEGVADFLARVMTVHRHQWAAPEGEDAPLSPDPLNASWPAGGVCLVPVRATAEETADVLLAVVKETTPTLRGVALGLQRPTNLAGPWRLRFHLPESTDPNHNRDLGEDWKLSAGPNGTDDCWMTSSGSGLDVEQLDSLLQSLLRARTRIVELDTIVFPRLPTTIRLGPGQPPLFCGATLVRVRQQQADPKKSWNYDISLRIDSRPVDGGATRRTSRLLLAQCQQVPQTHGEKLYRLVPPERPPAEAELGPAAQWKVEPAGATLLAARLAPGFVRDKAAAFYSRLEPSDLVWIRVADGELPLILGALHARCDRWEQGEHVCDVAIGVPQVEVGIGDEGGQLRLAKGIAQLGAPDELTLSAKTSQVSERLNVKGPIEAADTAVFKGDVTVG